MKTSLSYLSGLAAVAVLTGCQSIPPDAERGPNGTMAYNVEIEASPPGARIEVNNEVIGEAPLTLKIFGDPDGTFHDFGSFEYVVRALPVATNQFTQTRIFRTGHMMTPEDRIPRRIYFDMNQNTPPPMYGRPYYDDGGYYYGPPVVVGPRFYFGPGYYHRRHW
jgi:hypothetical protein